MSSFYYYVVMTFNYLRLRFQEDRLTVLRFHLSFYWLVLLGRWLARQCVGQLYEEQLLTFAQTPLVKKIRQNIRLREWRRLKGSLSLLYCYFLVLFLH